MKDSQKTLIILSPGFAKNEADTSCLPAQQIFLRALNRSFPGVKIILLAFQYPFTDKKYEWHGNEIIPFNGRNRGKLYRLLTWFRIWRTLSGLQKKENVTGILSFWFGECALIGHYFGTSKRLPHFSWIFGQEARKGNKYARWIKPHAGELIALSDFIVTECKKNYGISPAHVIPLGIDTQRYSAMPVERTIDILGAGSLIALKRYDLFIEVIKALQSTNPHIQAVLCGEGTERKKLETMIAEAGLQKSVRLAGERPHAEVLQLMQQSRIFLHPSSYEGFGVVCLEALYAGAKVISFCHPQHAWIRDWHHVNNTDEMIARCNELLHAADIDYKPVLAYTIDDTAKSVMQLFDQSEAASS